MVLRTSAIRRLPRLSPELSHDLAAPAFRAPAAWAAYGLPDEQAASRLTELTAR